MHGTMNIKIANGLFVRIINGKTKQKVSFSGFVCMLFWIFIHKCWDLNNLLVWNKASALFLLFYYTSLVLPITYF